MAIYSIILRVNEICDKASKAWAGFPAQASDIYVFHKQFFNFLGYTSVKITPILQR